jgi:hypothetical protein
VEKPLHEKTREALLVELDLHKTEFSALRDEILQWLDSEQQYLNMTLVAVAAALGIAPFILEQRGFITLLLFPIIFHVLLWEMLKTVDIITQIGTYLIDILIPRVNTILDELGDDREGTIVLGWEVRVRTPSFRPRNLLLAFIAPTRHWIPVIAVAALLIFYLIATSNYGYIPSLGELFLIIANLFFLIFAAVQNALVARSAEKDTSKLLKTFGNQKREEQ